MQRRAPQVALPCMAFAHAAANPPAALQGVPAPPIRRGAGAHTLTAHPAPTNPPTHPPTNQPTSQPANQPCSDGSLTYTVVNPPLAVLQDDAHQAGGTHHLILGVAIARQNSLQRLRGRGRGRGTSGGGGAAEQQGEGVNAAEGRGGDAMRWAGLDWAGLGWAGSLRISCDNCHPPLPLPLPLPLPCPGFLISAALLTWPAVLYDARGTLNGCCLKGCDSSQGP